MSRESKATKEEIQRNRDEAYLNGWNDGYAEGYGKATADAPTFTAADLERAYKKGLIDALGVIASLGCGRSEDVEEGYEQAFCAIEKHLSELKSADLAQRVKGPAHD